jgi:hypothetical protein
VFGQTLFGELSKKHEISSYGLCGSNPNDWYNPNHFKSNCRGEGTFTNRSNSVDKPLEQAEIKNNGLNKILEHHKPDTVIISLGDNFITDRGISLEDITVEVRNILERLPSGDNKVDCFWVTPTFGQNKKTDSNLDTIIKGIEEGIKNSGRECQIINSKDEKLKDSFGDDFTTDGIHLKNAASREWAKFVSDKMIASIGPEETETTCESVLTESEPLQGPVEDLAGNVQDVLETLETEQTPAEEVAGRDRPIIEDSSDYAYTSAYDYNEAPRKQPILDSPTPVKSSGGGIGGFFSSLFSGIANFFQSIFSGITAFFSSIFGITPKADLKTVDKPSTDPLERHSDITPGDLAVSDNDVFAMSKDSQVNVQEIDREADGGLGDSITLTALPFAEVEEVPRSESTRRVGARDTADTPFNIIVPEPTQITDVEHEDHAESPEMERFLREGRLGTNADNFGRLRKAARSTFAANGRNACNAALRSGYNNTKPKPIWGDLSLAKRAERIKFHAEYTLNKIKEQSNASASGNKNRDTNNPHYIHPLINKSVGICIPFIEVRGTLNPHAMNYTFCQANNSSTAHGLGQQTRTTFRNLRNFNRGANGGLLPLTVAKEYNNLKTDEIFHLLNNDVTLQMEVMYRYMNYELKRNDNKGLSDEQRLINAVAAYDQDNQSNYVRKFRQCHRCVQTLPADGDVMKCYNSMK